MCGIAGIYKFTTSLNESALREFTDAITHRGPDGSGYHVFEGNRLGFGHRRLSILDTSENGKQPFNYAGNLWITFNGEVYNFIELKKELIGYGYKFTTETDTEVILAAYHKWGTDCFPKFNGMWAMAIYDTKTRELLLCRDRFGVKPLFYLHTPAQFAFCSETIAFRNLEGYKREFDPAIINYAIDSPNLVEASCRSLFKNIYQVPPGHYIKINTEGRINSVRWWKLTEQIRSVNTNYQKQVEEFHDLFLDACKIRMRSDVSIASALSGGLDSSSVYCMVHHLMKQQLPDRIPQNWMSAFVATFPGTKQDERRFAEKVEQFLQGKVNYIPTDYSNLERDIISSTQKFDSITATPIICLTPIYKAMSENGIKVSLDGHGLDEIMYGYPASVAEAYYQAIIDDDMDYAHVLEETYAGLFGEEKYTESINRLRNYGQNEKRWHREKNSYKQKLKKLFIPSNNHDDLIVNTSGLNTYGNWFPSASSSLNYNPVMRTEKNPFSERGEKELFNEFTVSDIPYNLRDFDRGAMQHGIEIRMPFMDWRLVSYCFSMPQKSKLNGGYTKSVARDAMKGIMPEEIRTRKLKIGLSAPTAAWFNGELSTMLNDITSSSGFLQNNYFNGKVIKQFCEQKNKDKNWSDNEAALMWKVLNFYLIKS
jgi:asparagine synthase (glutamine-hydrolysing)